MGTRKEEYRPIEALKDEDYLWSDKKRPFFGLPISFTWYLLYNDRLIVKQGLFICRQEEIRLYRIADVSVRQSIFQRLFGVGSVLVMTSDRSAPKYCIDCIRQPYDVSHRLSELAERERRSVGIGFYESF